MPGTCIVGLQWGDEAKGKLVDLLTSKFDIVVRYQGGANAGHTVVAGDEVYKLHLIPSGILNPQVMNLISAGVVLNPETTLQEIDALEARGVSVAQNLMISDRAHVVLPWHVEEDRLLNSATADGEDIGTTLRGIGPCYRDKVGRSYALRLGDFYRSDLQTKIEKICVAKNKVLASMNGGSAGRLDPATIFQDYSEFAKRLERYVGDTTNYLLDALEADKRVLFEGAQGALLDIDHGTYPFVTSSNSSGVGVSTGSGIPGRWIERVYGVIKSYSTRVGGGPFPTEQSNETGEQIRQKGNEFGTTTGRPRRCGWFDAVAARYTTRLSGVDTLAVMMLDVLSGMKELKICVAYDVDGQRIEHFPSHVEDLRTAKPIYETLPGWEEEITEARTMDDLPPNAHNYLNRVSELVGRPVGVVSVGPDRAQTIFIEGLTPVA